MSENVWTRQYEVHHLGTEQMYSTGALGTDASIDAHQEELLTLEQCCGNHQMSKHA